MSSAHLRFRVPTAGRAAIAEVVAPYLEERYRDYVARYGFEPRGPVMFELYGDPHDFAVRTVGLPASGVAGVCFGRVITSQAPTNHAFNWGMVLAHELAHVFAIELSRSRVPALVHRGALRGRDHARCGPNGRATTTSPSYARASPRRAADRC